MGGQNAQLDPAAAQAVLFEEVYLPAFAEKCAELGIQFTDQDSVTAALETVSMLKQASQRTSVDLVKAAHAALCANVGVATPAQRKTAAAQEKKAATVASSNRIQAALAALVASKQE